MKLLITLRLPGAQSIDIALTCDVATSVGEVAQMLQETLGRRDSEPAPTAGHRADATGRAPGGGREGRLTLVGKPPAGGELLLDPLAPIGRSGLRSGWQVWAAKEFDATAQRLLPAVGTVEVLDGDQRGARFSLIAGHNSIGREARSRVLLSDRSVSRRHAAVEAGERLVLRDSDSANGIEVRARRAREIRIDAATDVTLGAVTLRITPTAVAAAPGATELDHRRLHTRAPVLDRRFTGSPRELPAPPEPQQATRVPVLAMLIPMLMGVVMFAVTRSAMSLLLVAFSPVMLLGSWLDTRLRGRGTRRGHLARFAQSLAAERAELAALREEESAVRADEHPALANVVAAVRARGRLLWARRPEHDAFLALRLGEGSLPSRTKILLPDRGESGADQWDALRETEREFARLDAVPVVEQLRDCGSIGIAGPPGTDRPCNCAAASEGRRTSGRDWCFPGSACGEGLRRSSGAVVPDCGPAGADREALVRALIVQLAGLHSPTELAIAACTGSATTGAKWEWLKWLPHVDPVGGPIPVWQLADTEATMLSLLVALEGVLGHRSSAGRGGAPQGASARGTPRPANSAPPSIPSIVVVVLDHGIPQPLRSRLIALAEEGPDVGIHLLWVCRDPAQVPAACRTFVEFSPKLSPKLSPKFSPKPLPSGLRSVAAEVSYARQGVRVALSSVEQLDEAAAAAAARELAPVEDAAGRPVDESDLPRRALLRDLHQADLLGGAAPVRDLWRRSGSLMSTWRRGEARDAIRLAAVVGQGAEGTVDIDLREHGPHALVGGTTGAGKSEFLQSWVMSLAANVSPDRLTFLFVDYKGGSAFAECVDIPHSVGLVTDLSPRLVRRALTSLTAELRRRERILLEHGAKDLAAMEQNSDTAAPPALVVVIDEFAALAREVPEFVDGVVDIAQRGRSLGLHLIMATQRPAGVVTENLRANTNLRVALRMADIADSSDVLGAPDAAFFELGTPGRCAVRVGQGPIEHFQAGYLGCDAGEAPAQTGLAVRVLGFSEGRRIPLLPTHPGAAGRRGSVPRDIERVRDALAAAAVACELQSPQRPWLDALPATIPLSSLVRIPNTTSEGVTGPVAGHPGSGVPDGGPVGAGIAVGLVDRPDAQTQEIVRVDLDHSGNLAVFGASGSGKTTALLTLAASASVSSPADPVHIYAIDAGGGGLAPLAALPNVGAVAPSADAELTQRVVRHVRETVRERQSRFSAVRAVGLADFRRLGGGGAAAEPRVLLLIDGLPALEQVADRVGDWLETSAQLAEIMRAGRAVGVHVALTADRPAALSGELAVSVQSRIALRLASPNDYANLDLRHDALEGAPPGRGMFAGRNEDVQIAFAGDAVDLAAQGTAIEELGAALRARGFAKPVVIRNAPHRIELLGLPVEADDRPVYGIDTRSLEGVGLPRTGLGVVAGPSGAGLTTATRSCVKAMERWAAARGETVERTLLTFARDPVPSASPALSPPPAAAERRELPMPPGGYAPETGTCWDRVARGAAEVEALARSLVTALGGRAPRETTVLGAPLGQAGWPPERGSSIETPAAPAEQEVGSLRAAARGSVVGQWAPPGPGAHGIIVVERPADAEDTGALPLLVALAKAARRADVLVLFEFELGSGSAVWELFTALKQPTWGLSLQPDEGEAQTPFRESLGRASRAHFPPGRGFAIERGRTIPVQVGIP